MKRPIVALTAAALLFGTGLGTAFADNAKAAADPAAYSAKALERSEARIAKLKADLKLTPDQEKLWPPVESAMDAFIKQRIERRAHIMEMRGQGGDKNVDILTRINMRGEAMVTSGTAMKQVASAAQPLYATFNDDQKKSFERILRRAEQHRKGDRKAGDKAGSDDGATGTTP
ncbi:Spy/CpxP family protein refolding chaperone [Ancylobacter sp. 6x-1]|uniref:Spy/CpxP family protein refolding chaperone n=1 Tax=Ancylobacter crimeensis TaxID=2579147 RepID=A0ABT0DE80_9HYPH|nr:Spy/CpxP family protein refolding chaperone [Ancylobacter crimeensis]MCK0198278.1 Spy/CpxP family protein refolding chaperone [Ancylobacter crimeensis]